MKNQAMALVSGLVFFALSAFAGSAENKPYKNLIQHDSKTYNKIVYAYPFIDWGSAGWFSKTSKFPNAKVFSIKSQGFIQVDELYKHRPIVLLVGSITCPAYDLNISKLRELAKRYEGKIDFYTLYVRENHPTDLYKEHSDFDQKKRAA
ncbi:MAG: deiodinase-like protein, partial [Bdellovibrionota bacterium]